MRVRRSGQLARARDSHFWQEGAAAKRLCLTSGKWRVIDFDIDIRAAYSGSECRMIQEAIARCPRASRHLTKSHARSHFTS